MNDNLKKQGATKENYNKVWAQVDIDANGTCSFNEFLPLCLDMEKMCTEEHLAELFALFD